MADVQTLMAQMSKASQAAHEELDAWMNDAGGTPTTVDAKVQAYRVLRAEWLAATSVVADVPPLPPEVPALNIEPVTNPISAPAEGDKTVDVEALADVAAAANAPTVEASES